MMCFWFGSIHLNSLLEDSIIDIWYKKIVTKTKKRQLGKPVDWHNIVSRHRSLRVDAERRVRGDVAPSPVADQEAMVGEASERLGFFEVSMCIIKFHYTK
jgi:hypothetical protein